MSVAARWQGLARGRAVLRPLFRADFAEIQVSHLNRSAVLGGLGAITGHGFFGSS